MTLTGAKVLCFNLTDEELRRLRACAEKAGASAQAVPQADFSQQVGAILGVFSRENVLCLSPFMEQMIIMCGFDHNKMESFLAALKAQGLSIRYKAMLTPTNLSWRCSDLVKELAREHALLHGNTGE